MTHDIPVVIAKVGEALPLSKIADEDPTLGEAEIKILLEGQIREHYSLFGIDPFKLEYSRPIEGYLLRPNAVVGLINCGSFILQISSKFEDVEIGKWLQLAHYASATSLVNHNNDVTETAVSDQDSLVGLDYFVLSLVSAVYDCVNQGLLYENANWHGPDPNFRGKLHVANHVKDGASPYQVQTVQRIKNTNCLPNAVIRTALDICIAKCANEKLRGLCTGLLPHFAQARSLTQENAKIECDYVSSIPRPDYEKALALSKIIIDGFFAEEGETESFIPYYTIDLDKLFESFVSFDIRAMLRPEAYRVVLQGTKPHPIVPNLATNFISPDIIVEPMLAAEHKAIILDAKNKYSLVETSGAPKIANPDIYQMVYYCLALDTNVAILVYPGNAKNHTKYPIPGSEGKAKYESKRKKALEKMFESGNCAFKFRAKSAEPGIYLIAWRLNLSGTLRSTRESVAQLCQFVADCSSGEILTS